MHLATQSPNDEFEVGILIQLARHCNNTRSQSKQKM